MNYALKNCLKAIQILNNPVGMEVQLDRVYLLRLAFVVKYLFIEWHS